MRVYKSFFNIQIRFCEFPGIPDTLNRNVKKSKGQFLVCSKSSLIYFVKLITYMLKCYNNATGNAYASKVLIGSAKWKLLIKDRVLIKNVF